MKTLLTLGKRRQEGSIFGYVIVVLIVIVGLASLLAYVMQTQKVAYRRNDMAQAQIFAEGAAVIACNDVNNAVTNTAGNFLSNLATRNYTKNTALSAGQKVVYERTISSPFSNQTVLAQISITNSTRPTAAKVIATTKVGSVTQSATVNLKMTWAYPGAIISTGDGTTSTSTAKTMGNGNVCVNGDKNGPIVVDGGILANGRVNIDTNYASIPPGTVSMTNANTANEIPDYTAQGTANSLFDFARFIAAADATTNSLNTATHNNHFTNIATFMAATTNVASTPAKFLEGIIVVDIHSKDTQVGNFDPSHFPKGINVKGTLFFNFGSEYGPTDKVINTAAVNVNPADLSGLVVTNPATYASGYPPVYYDNNKKPINIYISG
jgi:hypothetical protein